MECMLDLDRINHLLMIVPHQDDEVLMGAGLIYVLLQQKKRVTVAIVTNGDHQCKDNSKGRIRLKETLAGLSVLGLPEENVIFLGYADTGMSREESFLLGLYREKDGTRLHPSSASCHTYGLEKKPDFHSGSFGEPGAYTRETLETDLRELLRNVEPDCLLTTHASDLHGDHEGLFYFLADLLEETVPADRPRLLVGMVHSPEGDDAWPGRRGLTYTCPEGLEEGGLVWRKRKILILPKEMRGGCKPGNLKYEALIQYGTALEPGAVDYLLSFVKDEEIFWEISPETLTETKKRRERRTCEQK